MAQAEIEFLPDRLNRQAVVFLGLTDGELKAVALANLAAWVPLGGVCGAVLGFAVFGIGTGFLAAVGGVWLAAKTLRRLKRGKPAGYHEDRIRAWLEDRGVVSRTMLRETAAWDVRRGKAGTRR